MTEHQLEKDFLESHKKRASINEWLAGVEIMEAAAFVLVISA